MNRLTGRIPIYTIMKAIYTTNAFDTWFASITDKQTARRIQARIDRVEDGNFGDWKYLSDGVSELRIHHGKGIRIYFYENISEVILLSGGEKSSQTQDIEMAKKFAKQLMGK